MKVHISIGLESYYNLNLLSVCLFRIGSAVYGPILTKLGRKVEGGYGSDLRPSVSMATILKWCLGKKSDISNSPIA